MAADKMKQTIDTLWKDPEPKNWDKFTSVLKKSKIRYYKVVFKNKNALKKLDDLKDSYVELYGADYKLSYKAPLIKKDGKKIRGATIYLMGLLNMNR